MTGSHGNSNFIFLNNFYTDFHSGCTKLCRWQSSLYAQATEKIACFHFLYALSGPVIALTNKIQQKGYAETTEPILK